MTNFFYGFADFCQWCFRQMAKIENNLNFVIIVVGAVLFLIWLGWQHKFNKEAEKNGTLK